jgi:hypothetical protein
MAPCKNRAGDILIISDRFQDDPTVWLVTGHFLDEMFGCWYYSIRVLHDTLLPDYNVYTGIDSQLIKKYYRRKSTRVFRF